MGHYVHLSVVFACDGYDKGVSALAQKHLDLLRAKNAGKYSDDDVYSIEGEDNDRHVPEARWFLEDMSKRTGENPGPKGGLHTWGIVGNYTHGEFFVELLRPFFTELLLAESKTDEGPVRGGPLPFEHIIVFTEHEQTHAPQCWEIHLDELEKELVVKHHEQLPFCWKQH